MNKVYEMITSYWWVVLMYLTSCIGTGTFTVNDWNFTLKWAHVVGELGLAFTFIHLFFEYKENQQLEKLKEEDVV